MKKYWIKVSLLSIYFFIVLLIKDKFTINFIHLIEFTIILALGGELIKSKIDKKF